MLLIQLLHGLRKDSTGMAGKSKRGNVPHEGDLPQQMPAKCPQKDLIGSSSSHALVLHGVPGF